MEALIFDCDGVLVDTERDGHRVAFNRAFSQKGIMAEWGVDEYRELLRVAGGKERMKFYFDRKSWPPQYPDHDHLIVDLHNLKTGLFMDLISSGLLPLRSGVTRLIDQAFEEGIRLAVCSTSNEKAVHNIIRIMLGTTREKKFDLILAGDVVSRKKPDPEIYLLCMKKLNIDASRCVVIEDSRNGLLAAKNAGMSCVITTNPYTEDEDFREADLVISELGDPPGKHITINDLKTIINN